MGETCDFNQTLERRVRQKRLNNHFLSAVLHDRIREYLISLKTVQRRPFKGHTPATSLLVLSVMTLLFAVPHFHHA